MQLFAAFALASLQSQVQAEAYALLVGVGDYTTLGPSYQLLGPPNDVLLMHRTLVDVMGYRDDQIVTLVTGGAEAQLPTRAQILGRLAIAAERARAGEVAEFLLYLSGHGSQVPDQSGDEPDGRDEVFLPCDTTHWDEASGTVGGAILDDELEVALAAIRSAGARVVLIVDACHSGTLLRGERANGDADEGVRWRELSASELGVPAAAWPPSDRWGTTARDSWITARASGVVALYAARSAEKTPERELPNLLSASPRRRPFGLFTHSLATELRLTGGDETFGQLVSRIRARYEWSSVRSPRPSAEGDLDARIGGRGRPMTFQVLREAGRFYVQDHGLLHEAVVGSRFELFRTGQVGEADARLGEVRVDAVELDRSWCSPIGDAGWATLSTNASAMLVEAPVAPERLRLAYQGDAEGEAAFAKVLAAHPQRLVAALGTFDADWIIRAGSPTCVMRAEESYCIDGAHTLEVVLSALFRRHNLLRLAGHPTIGGLPEGLEVRVSQVVDGGAIPIAPGVATRSGTQVTLQARNTSKETRWIGLLFLDNEHGITEIELRGQGEVPAGAGWMRLEREDLEFKGNSVGLEHLLVFAFNEPATLPDLSQEHLQRAAAVPRSNEADYTLAEVLIDLSFGAAPTRGGGAPELRALRARVALIEVWTAE